MANYQSLFNVPTIRDFQKEEEDFNMRKQIAQAQLLTAQLGGNNPAAIQIADAIQKARAAGDEQRIKDLTLTSKIFDKGIVYDQAGNPVAMGGYGDAVGSIEGAKKAYEASAQNQSDLYYDPQIAGGEAQARLGAELGAAGGITKEKALGEAQAAAQSDLLKELSGAQKTLPIIEEIRGYNNNTADIPYAGSTRGFARLIPTEGAAKHTTNIDLLSQARTDLAAPLAKQLGVNPTDKDFKATLDRIFDIDASKSSRAAQIDALEKRIQNRTQQIAPNLLNDLNTPQNIGAQGQGSNPAITTPVDQIEPVLKAQSSMTDKFQIEESVFNAKKAINAGKDPNAVRQRLIDAGIDPAKAGL